MRPILIRHSQPDISSLSVVYVSHQATTTPPPPPAVCLSQVEVTSVVWHALEQRPSLIGDRNPQIIYVYFYNIYPMIFHVFVVLLGSGDFFLTCEDRMFHSSLRDCAFFYLLFVEITSCILIPPLWPGSVHSGSAS